MEGFELVALSPPGQWHFGVPIAAARAGHLGLLDLTLLDDLDRASEVLEGLVRLSKGRLGVHVDSDQSAIPSLALSRLEGLDTVLLSPSDGDARSAVSRWRGRARRIGWVVTGETDFRVGETLEVDFLVAKGHEAGGLVGEETTFVLLQRLLSESARPVYAWGGIGPRTIAAVRAAGAAGAVLDWQLSLTRESGVPPEIRRRVLSMEGGETVCLAGPGGLLLRAHSQLGADALEQLRRLSDLGCSREEWLASVRAALSDRDPAARPWLVGQDAAFAARILGSEPSVAKTLSRLRKDSERLLRGSAARPALRRDGELARSHGTSYPIVQGPMTRVSDTPEFCDAVERGGALPFLALALMNRSEALPLLERTRRLMGSRPWGVGILGFVDRDTRAEQLSAIEEVRPPYAIIAGGRPDQTRHLEARGIRTYLHVPSPALLASYLGEGARRFIFEGRECGGHVGPRTSFVLWELMIEVLLQAKWSREDLSEIHVLFAGGIRDARGGAMVSAMAQPLTELGMKVGALIGTAYLFTEEAVATQAIGSTFQEIALSTDRTILLETGPGHAIRCAPNPYTDRFHSERERMNREKRPFDEVRTALERMHVGRLRLASKGLARAGDPEREGRRELVRVSDEDQRREGMFMVGQVASLCKARTTIAALHADICDGAARSLARFQSLAVLDPPRPSPPPPLDVAIVGLSCLLPGAADADSFWQNVIGGHDAVTEIPRDRFDYRLWFDEDRSARDRIYSKWGGFLADVPFDPIRFGIPPAAIPSIEPMQLMALELVDRALVDAGYRSENPYKARTSVILGAGGGMAELGASYTVRAMLPALVENVDDRLYRQLPEWTEDSFAGILLNVIAGRISNRFDLGGVNYVVDAACASSLAAIYLACQELARGTSDMVIAGGCDTVQNPLSYLCFAKTGALSSSGRVKTFDAGADGIVISEGLAVVVLKRREEAERDGDRIYAVLRAVAGGSDGRERSLTAPAVEGQQRTLRRAYEQAGFNISTVGLFEAHGTGTALGDPTECRSLAGLLTEAGAPPASAAIGSVKSMIGHTKATAGVAGLIKATLALHHKVLPPTLHVERPNPQAGLESGPLYANSETRPWLRGAEPRRAAVSAFGFGGTNFHAVLEEYTADAALEPADSPVRRRKSEPFFFESRTQEGLAALVDSLSSELPTSSGLAEAAFRWHLRQRDPSGLHRAAIVAGSVEELERQVHWLSDRLRGKGASKAPRGVYTQSRPLNEESRVAFLFPGQGSQYVKMLGWLAVELSEVRCAFERADAALAGSFDRPLSRFVFPPPVFDAERRRRQSEALKATEVAQPALGAADVAMFRLLAALGVEPEFLGGHSYGELVALFAAGCYDEATLFRLSFERGRAMVARADAADLGGMIALSADEATASRLLDGFHEVWLANLNSPRQTIVSGTKSGLKLLGERLDSAGVQHAPVPVSCGFHSPLVAHARDGFARVLRETVVSPPRLAVYNNATAKRYGSDPETVRSLLAENLVSRVRFREEIEAMYRDGARLFVEVGPGSVLSNLVGQILSDSPHVAVPTHPKNADALDSLHHALALLFSHGVPVRLERLFQGRRLDSIEGRPSTSGNPLWLVNGAYARPSSEAPRAPRPEARLESRTTAATPATPATEPAGEMYLPSNGESEPAFLEFQHTMRRFLSTQKSALEAFFQGSSPPPNGHPERKSPPPPAVEASAPVPLPTASPEPSPVREVDPNQRLLAIVAERTGYPVEVLDPEADLEADLGIDSIKRVEIIAAFRREMLPRMTTPPDWFVEQMSDARKLSAISRGIRRLLEEKEGIAATSPCEKTAPDDVDEAPRCEAVVIEVERERYRSDVSGLPKGVCVLTDDGRGIARGLLEEIQSRGGEAAVLEDACLESRESCASAIESLRLRAGAIAGVLHIKPLSDAPSFPGVTRAEWEKHSRSEVDSMLFLLQAVVPELTAETSASFPAFCASLGGGDFSPSGAEASGECRHPWRGGLSGLLKTAAKEFPSARFRHVDFDVLPKASALFDELFLTGPVEVGYRSGRRLSLAAVRREIGEPDREETPLTPQSVLLVTGGARGITAAVSAYLAARAPARFILVGRSLLPPDEEDETRDLPGLRELRRHFSVELSKGGARPRPRDVEALVQSILASREIRSTLARIRGCGGAVEYISCDVRDAESFRSVLEDVESRYGRIDLFLHGAGVIEDKLISDKSAESFDRVLQTKISPLLTLAEVFAPADLPTLVLFSSVAGFYGNIGQGDYAAANEILNRMARRLRDLGPVRSVSMNWGPWEGAGMVAPEVAEQFRARGIGLVPVEQGAEAVWKELSFRGRNDVRVLVGAGPWVVESEPVAPKSEAELLTGSRV